MIRAGFGARPSWPMVPEPQRAPRMNPSRHMDRVILIIRLKYGVIRFPIRTRRCIGRVSGHPVSVAIISVVRRSTRARTLPFPQGRVFFHTV